VLATTTTSAHNQQSFTLQRPFVKTFLSSNPDHEPEEGNMSTSAPDFPPQASSEDENNNTQLPYQDPAAIPSVEERLILAFLDFSTYETRLANLIARSIPVLENTIDPTFIFLHDRFLIRDICLANRYRASTFTPVHLHGYKLQMINYRRTIAEYAAGRGLSGQLWNIREMDRAQYNWRRECLRSGYVLVVVEVKF
jgi:hypothetical protein